jgi:tyrosinase
MRKDVWKLPEGDKTLFWYGKAIGELQKRPITDLTSWRSLGAMHGFQPQIWTFFGYVSASTTLPPGPVRKKFWDQCQHQTWFFLPWHRGYLAAFEAIVRDAIVKLGGPNDWTLPYWNYSRDAQSLQLPPAFADATLPNGEDNHLFVKQRYGIGETPIVLDERAVLLSSTLEQPHFQGLGSGGTTGFGGVKTLFNHAAQADGKDHNGVLERQPHGVVHVLVGGGFKNGQLSRDWRDLGLMTNPDTAALDPIFWLHHANIDRLWNVWLRQRPTAPRDPTQFKDPTDTDWLNGPLDQAFAMPKPDGTDYTFKPRDMLDTTVPSLDYVYDDDITVQPELADALAMRFRNLGASPARANEMAGAVRMTPPKPAELVGANDAVLRLNNDTVETKVRLDGEVRSRLTESLELNTSNAAEPRAPDRVYLNLENIKSPSDAAAFYVYINLPPNADPKAHPELLAGTISMFGSHKASVTDGPHAGNGISESLDITRIVDALHVDNALASELSVKLVSAIPGATGDDISIDRISVYRQSQ